MKLILENVRSFAGRHEIPIKPLTLLVGENSSGKSTVLAALSVACQFPEFPIRPRWDQYPYRLGTFDTIATKRSRTMDRFALGIQDLELNSSVIWAEYCKQWDRIVPSRVQLRWRETTVDADVNLDGEFPPKSATVKLSHMGVPIELDS